MSCRYSLHIWCPDMWYLGTGNFAKAISSFLHKHISRIIFIVATNCYSDFAEIYLYFKLELDKLNLGHNYERYDLLLMFPNKTYIALTLSKLKKYSFKVKYQSLELHL